MIRIIIGLILAILYFFVFCNSYKRTRDIFSPLCFFSLLQVVAYVPGIMFFEKHLNIELDEINVFIVFIMQIITILFIWLGSYSYRKNFLYSKYQYKIIYNNSKYTILKGILIFSFGASSYLIFVSRFGGIWNIMQNTQVDYAAGNSYFISLWVLMPIGVLTIFDSKKKPKVLMSIMFMLYAAAVLIFTRRAPVMEGLMAILFAINYRVKKIKLSTLFKPKSIILVLIFSIVILIMPQMRSSQGFKKFDKEIIESSVSNIFRIFEEFSFTSRDAFIYENYQLDNMYYGRTIFNILLAPVPSRLVPWKPPVDDGVYLANFVSGYYISPPSNRYIIKNSFPFSSQGSMYANFGIFGVIIGSFFLGYVYEIFYSILINSKFNSLMIYIYQVIMYKFALSSKNVTQTLILIVLVLTVFRVFNKIKVVRELKKCKTAI